MDNTNLITAEPRTPTTFEWLKQRKSSVATLIAGVAILLLSAASGYLAADSGIDWLDLSIYLFALVVVVTQSGRLLRACMAMARKSTNWARSRMGER